MAYIGSRHIPGQRNLYTLRGFGSLSQHHKNISYIRDNTEQIKKYFILSFRQNILNRSGVKFSGFALSFVIYESLKAPHPKKEKEKFSL